MFARDIMSTPAVTISSSASIGEAVELMLARGFSGLPVCLPDGSLIGMITEGDFLRRGELETEKKRSRWLEFLVSAGKAADEYVHSHGRKVEEIMSTHVWSTRPDAELNDIVSEMIDRRIKRVPVVDDGRIVGIVSRSDLLRALAARLPVDTGAATDGNLQYAIATELRRCSWSFNGSIRVAVKSGVATLGGVIFDERERTAARVAAENVPGVTSVLDELTWVDPNSGMSISPPGLHGGL